MTRTHLRKLSKAGATLIAGLFLLFTPLSPVPTPVTHGQWAVAVVSDAPSILDRIVDGLAWAAAKTAIQSMTQSIVNWINSGFEGSPAFVTDLKRNLSRLGDAVAEDFIRGLDDVIEDNTGFSIRAPFQDQIADALREEYYRTTSSYGFDVRHPYRDCYGGRGFSWNAFLCQSRNDANNPYGRYMIARNELFDQIDQEAQHRLRELDWGNGFLSWRGSCGNSQAAINQAKRDGKASAQGTTNDLNQRDNTVGCSIRTPGTLIEDQLVESFGSPVRQLEIADSVNEIVAALMTQMVSQVLGGNGLSGVSRPSSGGGPSYLDRATDATASLSSGFAQNITEARTSITRYQSDWQRIRGAASAAVQACRRNSSALSEASSAVDLANTRLNQATTALQELSSIEAERVRLTSSSSSSNTAITQLINRFQTVLSSTGSLAEGTAQANTSPESGSLYSRMVELADDCR